MNISKSKIKTTGSSLRKCLRENQSLNHEDLERLQFYRVSHQDSLQLVFNYLTTKSKQHYKGSLTVYRLKRIDTILRKIERYPNMDLSKMQDIAGCRTIVGSENQINKIIQEIYDEGFLEVISIKDYLQEPRDTGYKSIHLIVKPKGENQIVEIQLRTRSNHHWATLVEITDLIYGIKLKEGEDHPQLYRFHKLLSIDKLKLQLEEKLEIINIEKELKVISRILSVFRSNYFIAVDRWAKTLPEKNCQYLIMEIDENFSPIFYFFEGFEEAEKAYFEKFSLNEPNMVLIHVNESNFEKIGLAYSNYILTSHPSVSFYIEILQTTILDQIKVEDFKQGLLNYEYYDELIDEILATFEIEITSLKIKLDRDELMLENISDKKKYEEIIEEWILNFSERFDYLKKTHTVFLNQFEKNKIQRVGKSSNNNENSIIQRFFKLITRK